jgi:hypothetical protein
MYSAAPAACFDWHCAWRVRPTGMVFMSKRPGRRMEVRFMPGCLIWSLLLSIALTILVNVLIRLF